MSVSEEINAIEAQLIARPVPGPGEVVVDLRKGHWALLRDPDELSMRDTRRIVATLDEVQGGDNLKGLAATDEQIVIVMKSWSLFNGQHPRNNRELMLDVHPRDHSLLAKGVQAYTKELFPDSDEIDPDDASPT